MKISLPSEVQTILRLLNDAGHRGYCVGGAVRDSVMGVTPTDWDVTTSATPEEIAKIFKDYKTIETGIKHGTLTVIINHKPFEITTFRIDGEYDDNRHPLNVQFTKELESDLARRDFTINALAYNEQDGLVDLYSGQEHIYNSIIKTVGDPDKRFQEDGLRIMRALRFSSCLNFSIEEETKNAIHNNKALLKNISAERIAVELTKLLCGKNVFSVLMEYSDVLSVIIPEIEATVGFRQHGKKHAYDVWEHICHTVDTIPPEKDLRLTMLLHDLGKIPTHKLNEKGDSTFKNHALVGGEMAKEILTRLKFDKKTINRVSFLVSCHDFEPCESKVELKRHLKSKTPDDIRTLLIIKKSDRGALSESYRDISQASAQNIVWLQEIEENKECCNLKDLALSGNDLLEKGFKGEEIGNALNKALDGVIEGKINNNKTDLLTYLLQ